MSSVAAPEVSAAIVLRAIAEAHRKVPIETPSEPEAARAEDSPEENSDESQIVDKFSETQRSAEQNSSREKPVFPREDEKPRAAKAPAKAPAKATVVRGVIAEDEEEAPAPALPEMPSPRGWSAGLLSNEGGAKEIAARMGIGVGLASVYGLAIGAREGGLSLLRHALGVPSALLAVVALGLPALYIVLSLLDAPLDAKGALRAASRGVVTAGLVLAGLAPAAALFVITSEEASAAALAAGFGLVLGGALGLRHLGRSVASALKETDSATRGLSVLCLVGFGVFAVVLASRVWGALLPLLGGA